MPKYTYRCKTCNKHFDLIHHPSEPPRTCADIEVCKQDSELEKVFKAPPKVSYPVDKETGKVVKEAIEEAKEELEREKKELSSRIMD